MSINELKGKLLEFFIRNIFYSCGFTDVKSDGLYSYENNGLYYLHGKGAAHDMDVLVEPPFQVPFSYPTRLIFECKAYNNKINLKIIRNVLGLRQDINDFEIVTKESLAKRMNNRRAAYAIEQRKRYFYQVGVASITEFTKNAIEFAANNKIPLISLKWINPGSTFQSINNITESTLRDIGNENYKTLITFLKDRKNNSTSLPDNIREIITKSEILNSVFSLFNYLIKNIYFGFLETGEFIVLHFYGEQNADFLSRQDRTDFFGMLYYSEETRTIWRLEIQNHSNGVYEFFLPKRIINTWKSKSYGKKEALTLKEESFAKIYIYNKHRSKNFPFYIIKLDLEKIEVYRNEMER